MRRPRALPLRAGDRHIDVQRLVSTHKHGGVPRVSIGARAIVPACGGRCSCARRPAGAQSCTAGLGVDCKCVRGHRRWTVVQEGRGRSPGRTPRQGGSVLACHRTANHITGGRWCRAIPGGDHCWRRLGYRADETPRRRALFLGSLELATSSAGLQHTEAQRYRGLPVDDLCASEPSVCRCHA